MESDKVLEFYERRIFVVVVVVVSSQVRFWGEGKEEEQQQSYFGEFERFRKDSQGFQKKVLAKSSQVFSLRLQGFRVVESSPTQRRGCSCGSPHAPSPCSRTCSCVPYHANVVGSKFHRSGTRSVR